MEETDRIKQNYFDRNSSSIVIKNNSYGIYTDQLVKERQDLFKRIILSEFKNPGELLLMDVGAGKGANIPFFKTIGIKDENIFANELLEDRVTELKNNFPNIHAMPGDANHLTFEDMFHIVFQSTVFTSILDLELKKNLAKKLWEMAKPNGIILWYDFMFDNPKNKSVKGIKKREIKTLFGDSEKIEFYKVTLAPPIGRRFQNLYKFLNSFSFLRTHVIAVIHK